MFFFYFFVLFAFFCQSSLFSENRYAQIDWEKDSRSEEYLLQISEDEKFFSLVHEEVTKENSIQLQLSDKITDKLFGRVAGIGKYQIKGFFSKPFRIKIMVIEKLTTPKEEKKEVRKTREIKEEQKLDVYYNDTRPFVSNRVGFSFATGDSESGGSETYYKLNQGAFEKYTGSFYFPKEGRNTITYYSVDKVGNKERLKEAEFYLDTKPPLITIKPTNFYLKEGENFSGQESFFQISAVDEGSDLKSLEYSMSAGGKEEGFFLVKENEVKIPKEFANSRVVLTVRATDNLGNQSEKKYFFYNDTLAPFIQTDIPKGKEYFKLNSKIKIFADDTKSGLKWVRFSLNGGREEFYADSIQLVSEGKQTIKIVAEDNVGNISTSEISNIQVLSPKTLDTKLKLN